MTDRIREQTSALLDGELPGDEVGLLVRRLERDEELRRAFGSYVLTGEVLRSPGGRLASAGFAARVSAALDEGGAIGEEPAAATPLRGRWMRPAVATAVAASAALVAVLLVRPESRVSGAIATDTLHRVSTAFAPAIFEVSSPTPDHSQRLAGYLVAHAQFASAIGRRNVWSGVLASDPGIGRVSDGTSLEAP